MDMLFLPRVLGGRCLVSLRRWPVEFNDSSSLDLTAVRTSSKRRRSFRCSFMRPSSKIRSRPPDLTHLLRLGSLSIHRFPWFQIRLKLIINLNSHSPNRISNLTGAAVAVGCNLTVILFGDDILSDEQSTISTTCSSWIVLMVRCCWAWPIIILKACSLAIIEYGPSLLSGTKRGLFMLLQQLIAIAIILHRGNGISQLLAFQFLWPDIMTSSLSHLKQLPVISRIFHRGNGISQLLLQSLSSKSSINSPSRLGYSPTIRVHNRLTKPSVLGLQLIWAWLIMIFGIFSPTRTRYITTSSISERVVEISSMMQGTCSNFLIMSKEEIDTYVLLNGSTLLSAAYFKIMKLAFAITDAYLVIVCLIMIGVLLRFKLKVIETLGHLYDFVCLFVRTLCTLYYVLLLSMLVTWNLEDVFFPHVLCLVE